MRGMTDHMTTGQRVAFYRRRRGMSQEVLAGLVGKTGEWLRKIETNRAEIDRLSVIRLVAKALDVSIGDLIGEPNLFEWSPDSGHETISALRAALYDYRHLTPATLSSVADERPLLADVRNDVTDAWDRYQRSQYGILASRLPHVLHESQTAAWVCTGDDGRRAHALMAYANQVAALFLTKLGETDLAWIAATRGMAAANSSNDHIVIASLSRAAAHALACMGEYRQALGLASAAADFLRPHLSAPTPLTLSVQGSLHLVCALAAARDDDRPSADMHIAEAESAAAKLGDDGNFVWTAFGPTNVKIHQVVVANEFGDVQRAIEIGPYLDTSQLPVERRVRHAIEVARAHARWNRVDEALETLLSAEEIAPEQVRYHRMSRALIREIISRPRPPSLALRLSERMGIGSRASR
jgi:transcriptional regulator with XRE-family HTH domain